MASVIGPDFVALQVRDLAVAQRFYTEHLGLEVDPAFTTPAFVVFKTQPIPFGIRATAPGGDLDAGDRASVGVDLWLNCDDADALHAALDASGVPILRQSEDPPFGRRFICRDPDGYELVVYRAIPLDRVRLNP